MGGAKYSKLKFNVYKISLEFGTLSDFNMLALAISLSLPQRFICLRAEFLTLTVHQSSFLT